jgi:hypothetical protein
VISCQIYGDYVRKKRNKADNDKKRQIDLLLKIFPHLRIAYTDAVSAIWAVCPQRRSTENQQASQKRRWVGGRRAGVQARPGQALTCGGR